MIDTKDLGKKYMIFIKDQQVIMQKAGIGPRKEVYAIYMVKG